MEPANYKRTRWCVKVLTINVVWYDDCGYCFGHFFVVVFPEDVDGAALDHVDPVRLRGAVFEVPATVDVDVRLFGWRDLGERHEVPLHALADWFYFH